jgi:uncharacterized protein YrrD
MLILGQTLVNKSILSLRTGSPIGALGRPVINPDNLRIEGWHADNRLSRTSGILISQDVRDVLPQGVVVDDHDVISDPKELVRLKPVLDIDFEIIGKQVVTENKQKLGKVVDYAFDKDSFFINKIHVSPSLLKSFGGDQLIDRSQVVETTNRQIVVREATVTEGAAAVAPVPVQ